MLVPRYLKMSVEGAPAGGGGAPPTVPPPQAPAAPTVQPAAPTGDDLRAKLTEGSQRKNRELAAANADLEAKWKAATEESAKLAQRLEAIETANKKSSDEAAAKARSAAFDVHFEAAKVKPKWRAWALGQLGDLAPDSKEAAAKVDALVKANTEIADVPDLKAPPSVWQGGTQPNGQQGQPQPGQRARPSGRDFAPPDRIPR